MAQGRTYAGRIHDGPWAGKQFENSYSSFTIAFCPPHRVGDDRDDFSGAVEDIAHGEYRWHDVLGAWVWAGTVK